MEPHRLDAPSVKAAVQEVVMRDHLIASASSDGDYKKLYFNPETDVYRIKTKHTEHTCKTAEDAARIYSSK
jgi:hypothetical protein